MTNERRSGYVETGGLNVFYDIEGEGSPLLLFHGGMATIGMFEGLRRDLSRRWTTIGIEQQGHGHTADIDHPLRFPQMVDDTAAVIRHLSLTGYHAFGYSDGGNIALGLAIRHPELIGRIAICGTNANNAGLELRMLKHLQDGARQDPEAAAAMLPAMMRDDYRAVAPDPDGWPRLVHRVFELAATFEGWTEAQLMAITAPVLIMAGDRDVVTVEHAAWLSRRCPAGQLCILPRTDHLAPVSRAGWIAPMLDEFYTVDLADSLPMEAAHD